LRTSEDDGFDASDFPWETMQDFHSYCAFLPSGFERYGILEISSQPATSPAYLARGIKTDCDHSYRRFYDGIWGDFSSWRTGGWSQGLLRMPGILGGLSLEQGSHNAIGASDSAIVPERLPPTLRPASRGRNQALHRQHDDDVRGEQEGIEVSGNHGRAAAPPPVVKTPWVRLGTTSSTFELNLYADRLSRRRRVVDYLPSLDGVREHWWIGDSEQNLKLDWSKVDLLRPPLEMLPLVPDKAHQDCFKGLMLVQCWPRLNWYQELMAMGHSSCDLIPNLPAKGKRWRTTLISFSPASASLAREKGWLTCGKREWRPSLRESRVACSQERASQVAWIRSQNLIAESYSDSHIQAFSTPHKRFIEFCEVDAYDWLVAGKHVMCAWIVHMYETSTIAGSTMEQYVSGVNRAYETSGLDPPGKPVNEISCMSKSESLSTALSVLEKSMVLLGRFLPYRSLTM
jgi:hypothetical protein